MDNFSAEEAVRLAVINGIVLRSQADDVFVADIAGDNPAPIQAYSRPSQSCTMQDVITSDSGFSVTITWSSIRPHELLFKELVKAWRSERNPLLSLSRDTMRCPAYIRIIGMGPEAVPLILREIRRELKIGEPDDWFIALWAITGQNPVPSESRGKTKEMAEAWLRWGIQEGLLHAESVGGEISTIGRVGMPQSSNTIWWDTSPLQLLGFRRRRKYKAMGPRPS